MNQQNLTHASRKPLSVEIGGVAHLGRYQTEKKDDPRLDAAWRLIAQPGDVGAADPV
jgi:hypothetical protein